MSTTIPPILLRNTYPPGQPEIGSPPKPLRKTPQAVTQIMFPDGTQSTHFQGPVVSGPAPGVQGAAGSARLTLSLQVDGTMGNFSVPIRFPGGSLLESISAVTYATGLAATVELGTTQGAADVATVTLPAYGAFEDPVPPGVQMPLWDAALPEEPFQIWLTVAGNTVSTGGAIILINYIRLAGPWSDPARDYSRMR